MSVSRRLVSRTIPVDGHQHTVESVQRSSAVRFLRVSPTSIAVEAWLDEGAYAGEQVGRHREERTYLVTEGEDWSPPDASHCGSVEFAQGATRVWHLWQIHPPLSSN